MTDSVAIALITGISSAVSVIGGIIIAQLNKVKQIVNGRQTDMQARIDRAEKVCPGITRIPQAMETTIQMSVNDPTNTDPPIVMQHDSPSIAPIVSPSKGTL